MPKRSKRTRISCTCSPTIQCGPCAARENPSRTKMGRVLRIENCPPELASRLLLDRKAAKRAHRKPPTRYGNCDYRAAEWALQLHRKHQGAAPSGLSWLDKIKAWAHLGLIDSWW